MKEKIKVLFLITQSGIGGAQRFFIELLPNLDRNKYEIYLAAGKEGNWESFENLNIKSFKLRHAKRNISPLSDLLVIFELRKLIKKLGPDVLFLNSSKTSIWGPLAIVGLKQKPKIIYRIGGWSFNDPQPKYLSNLWIKLERRFAKYKDYIIVNSRHDLDQAKELKIKPKKELKLIHNGIDPESLNFLDRNSARKELGLNDNDYLVGTIANFYKTKGLEYIIPTAVILKESNHKFVLIGDGRGRNELERLVKENELENKVILLGRKKDAYKYLKAFDVFLLPSLKEGFPWVILEAMAAKVPVIATNVGATPEIIKNEYNGIIIESKKPQQIVEALERIENINIVENAYETISAKFSLNKMVSSIESVIDNSTQL